MSNYSNQTKLKAYLRRELSAKEIDLVQSVLDAVDDWIDRETGFSWKSTDAGKQRIYPGGGLNLFIDPVSEITAVEWINLYGDVTYSFAEGLDYQALPLNKDTKTYLKRLRYYGEFDEVSDVGRWPANGQGIRVTGTFGEAGGVPKDISLAATMLAADWLNNEYNLKEETIEGYRRIFADPGMRNPQVDQIIASRRRILL